MSLSKLKEYLNQGKKPTGGFIQESVVRNSLIQALMNGGMFSKVKSNMQIEFEDTHFSFKDSEATQAENLMAEFNALGKISHRYATHLS